MFSHTWIVVQVTKNIVEMPVFERKKKELENFSLGRFVSPKKFIKLKIDRVPQQFGQLDLSESWAKVTSFYWTSCQWDVASSCRFFKKYKIMFLKLRFSIFLVSLQYC